MARKVFFLIWLLSALAIGFLAFMPDYMGRSIYLAVFPRNYYSYAHIIPFCAHLVFFFFNCLFLLLLLNTSRQINEMQKLMVTFVWVVFLTICSELGQMYLVPAAYNRSGLNLKDAVADFMGFFAAWLFYFIFVKMLLGSRRVKQNS